MSRSIRGLRAACAPLAIALAFTVPAGAQMDFSKVEMRAEKVAGNVWMISGHGGFGGGNIGVSVGDDGLVIVDSSMEPLAPQVEARLKELSPKPLRFVLNTHHHGDHTHGNKIWGSKATVVAHDNVRKRMEVEKEFDGTPGTVPPPQALPILTFDSKVSLHVNGEEIRGLHFPSGHTDGDTVVFFTGSNVVHMGDDFFHGLFPFVDLDSGGSLTGYIAAIDAVVAQIGDATKVIPGHGPLATKADLAAYSAMLKETSEVVRKGVAAGKSLEQLKAAKVLAAWDRYSWDFISTDAYLEMAYKSLSKK
jgi:glyoxylase-like metal-dependent hydrolase (beta-lactamase superfamily II)